MSNVITECGIFKRIKENLLQKGYSELMAHNIAFMICYPVYEALTRIPR